MDTPAPVNLAALKGILANAKKVMNKVEENTVPKSGNKTIKEERSNIRLIRIIIFVKFNPAGHR